MTKRIAINGFGRIGRVIFRILNERAKKGMNDLEVVAINDLTDAATNAHLLKYDSVHRRFDAEVKAEKDAIVVNGKAIKIYAEKDPSKLPWKDLDIDVVVESSGAFTANEKLLMHVAAGAKKVDRKSVV